MEDTTLVKKLRDIGREVLEVRYGDLEPLTGQGIQSGTRFALQDGSDRKICVIKVVTQEHGRIHFPRALDGTWSTLRDVDLILYVRRRPGRADEYEAHMYSQSALLSAFDKNWSNAVVVGITNLPAWLSPEREAGDRFIGSGFGDRADWKQTGSLSERVSPVVDESVQPLTIQQAKRGIAASLGISPDAIEITIRA